MNSKYSEKIREAMRAGSGRSGQAWTIEELAVATGFSYESVRKIYAGNVSGSKELNEHLCHILKLDTEQMWILAQREKIASKLGTAALTALPQDQRLVDLWPQLTDADRERLIVIAHGMALSNQVGRVPPPPREPKTYPGSRGKRNR